MRDMQHFSSLSTQTSSHLLTEIFQINDGNLSKNEDELTTSKTAEEVISLQRR